MIRKKHIRSLTALLLLLVLALSLLAGCGGTTETESQTEEQAASAPSEDMVPWIRSVEDLAGKDVGIMTGSINEQDLLEAVPDANVVYFNNLTDMAIALDTGKIDAYVEDEAVQRFVLQEYPSFSVLTQLSDFSYGTIFPMTDKGQELCEQMNAFLADIREDGTMDEIDALWFGTDDSRKTLDTSDLTGENGTLKMAVSSSVGYPFAYVKDEAYVGYDLDIAVRFCRAYGYGLTVEDYSFDGLLAAVTSGKCDIGGSGITVTEERAESVCFSDPTYYSGSIILVRTEDIVTETAEAAAEDTAQVTSLAEQYAGQSVGVITGSIYDQLVAERLPDCSIEYFNSASDMALALDAGKVDCYVLDEPSAMPIFREHPNQGICASLEKTEYAFLFPKDTEKTDRLRLQMNEFLAKIKADGTMELMKDIWLGEDESLQVVDYEGLTGENGTLEFAISTEVGVPFAYLKDNNYVGYDVDMAVRFCREYGYDIHIVDSYVSGFLASVTTGKSDFGASSVAITEERKESMEFSDPNYEGGVVLVTNKENITEVVDAAAETEAYEPLRGKKIGVVTGMICDTVAEEWIPECQIEYFNSNSDLALALETGKIDAYLTDEPVSRLLLNQYPGHTVFRAVTQDSYGYIFQKGSGDSDALREQMNEFLQKLRDDGTLQELDDIWFGQDESRQIVDYSGLTGENGLLNFATSSVTGAPFCYLKEDTYVGYDIDIVVRFCREYGYDVKIVDSDFNGMLANVAFGKCDFGGSCITITEERQETVNFSDPNYTGGFVLVVSNADTANTDGSNAVSDPSVYEEIRGCKIGVFSGSVFDELAEETVPDCERVLLNSNADLGLALDTDKIDAYMTDEPSARILMNTYTDEEIFAYVRLENYAFILPKDGEKSDTYQTQMNEFLQKLREDGTMEEMKEVWLGTNEKLQVIDDSGLTGENGTIRYASSSSVGAPFCYLKDDQYVGYEVDLMVRFCREYGYSFEMVDSDFSGVLANVTAGKCDMGGGSIAITEERKETMRFTDPCYEGGAVLVVKSDGRTGDSRREDILASIRESFSKTFLREDRWRLFVGGVGVTLLITVLSAVCGTVLAFLLFLLYRKQYRVARIIVDVMSDILQKTPVVVILMILYYIIFGKLTIDSMWVSCIGFSLIFTGSVIGLLKVAVGAVDGGQMEAALALGYTDTHAFLRVILPQAMEHFLPGYKSEIVAMIKGTAVVGYIAVQDLTKVSDIVRSRTYEAFFPLIATAVIYYGLAWILTLLVNRVRLRTNPKHRSNAAVLKGVKTK